MNRNFAYSQRKIREKEILPFVHSIWELKGESRFFQNRIDVPHPLLDLVVPVNCTFIRESLDHTAKKQLIKEPYVAGPRLNTVRIVPLGNTHHVYVVRITLKGFSMLTKKAPSAWFNKITPIGTESVSAIAGHEHGDFHQFCEEVETYFLKTQPTRFPGEDYFDPDLGFSADPGEVATSTYYYRAKAYAGITPKELAQLKRISEVLNALLKYPGKPIHSLCQEFGYCDTSHLRKELKKIIGVSPKGIKNQLLSAFTPLLFEGEA